VIDLYSRVNVGTKIIVLPNHSAVASVPARALAADARSANVY